MKKSLLLLLSLSFATPKTEASIGVAVILTYITGGLVGSCYLYKNGLWQDSQSKKPKIQEVIPNLKPTPNNNTPNLKPAGKKQNPERRCLEKLFINND